jgi:hypothetical protein
MARSTLQATVAAQACYVEVVAGHHTPRDYSQTPLNVYWEMTQACALACRHCRAESVPDAHPEELTFAEGVSLLRQITEFGDWRLNHSCGNLGSDA